MGRCENCGNEAGFLKFKCCECKDFDKIMQQIDENLDKDLKINQRIGVSLTNLLKLTVPKGTRVDITEYGDKVEKWYTNKTHKTKKMKKNHNKKIKHFLKYILESYIFAFFISLIFLLQPEFFITGFLTVHSFFVILNRYETIHSYREFSKHGWGIVLSTDKRISYNPQTMRTSFNYNGYKFNIRQKINIKVILIIIDILLIIC